MLPCTLMARPDPQPCERCGVWRAVVAAQEAVAAQVLRQCSTRASFHELFSRLYNYPKYGLPAQHGEPGGVLRRVGACPPPAYLWVTHVVELWCALCLLFGWTSMQECRTVALKATKQQGSTLPIYSAGLDGLWTACACRNLKVAGQERNAADSMCCLYYVIL